MVSSKDKLDEKIVIQIKEARERQQLTQAEVAEQAGMTVTYYAMIERGEVNPTWGKLERLFKVLDLKFLLKKE